MHPLFIWRHLATVGQGPDKTAECLAEITFVCESQPFVHRQPVERLSRFSRVSVSTVGGLGGPVGFHASRLGVLVGSWRALRSLIASTLPPMAANSNSSAMAADKEETDGLRLHQRQPRSHRSTGRAAIGSCRRKRCRSSARAAAVAYRLLGLFSRHFRQMVSRSRGTLGFNTRGETGSLLRT